MVFQRIYGLLRACTLHAKKSSGKLHDLHEIDCEPYVLCAVMISSAVTSTPRDLLEWLGSLMSKSRMRCLTSRKAKVFWEIWVSGRTFLRCCFFKSCFLFLKLLPRWLLPYRRSYLQLFYCSAFCFFRGFRRRPKPKSYSSKRKAIFIAFNSQEWIVVQDKWLQWMGSVFCLRHCVYN